MLAEKPKIRFIRDFDKLPNSVHGKKARLFFTRIIELEKQTQAFLEFDTRYRHKPFGHYELSQFGKRLLLIFDCEGCIFTTIRQFDWKTYDYYRGLEGELLEVVLDDL